MQRSASATVILYWAVAAIAPAQSDKRQWVQLDQVVSTVNDAAILMSTLRATVDGPIGVKQQELGRPLTPAESGWLHREALEKLIDAHCMAQAAKTLGILPPQRVEELVQERLKEATRERVRQLGGEQRFSQELREQGSNWQTFVRDERLQIMSVLTEQIAIYGRLQNQKNLFITPRMMRDFYQQNRQRYVHGPRALVAWVGFLVEGNREEILTRANAAAEAWDKEALTSQELSKRFPGARPMPDVDMGDEAAPSSLQPFVREFGLSNPAGKVAVIPQENAVWVLRVQDVREASKGAFEDLLVQADIRRELEQDVMLRLRLDAVKRSRERTYVWLPGQ